LQSTSGAVLRALPVTGLSTAKKDEIETAPSCDAPWHVLYVKSRQEKAMAADLERLGISYYLPLQEKLTYYGARRFRVFLALFPGYLFMRGNRHELQAADRTKRLVRVIAVRDQQRISWELTNIRLALTNGAELGPCKLIQRGCRVCVNAGPFKDLEGIVEDRLPANRLILQVDMLGQAVSMEIDGDLLEVLAQPKGL
jgi:transcription termination/antitermination protein NusG